MKFIDLTGQRFGKLVVLHRVNRGNTSKTEWLCKCDCGNESIVRSSNLRDGHIRSCGCLISETNRKHGQWNTRLYRIYYAMKQRTQNPNSVHYKYYGAIGVRVCPEWDQSFEAFYNWAIQNGYDDQLSIDRIDPSGDYEPTNCRWADKTTQSFNRKLGTDNASGQTGVSLRKDTGKYQAYISKNGKRKVLGSFSTFDEAVQARKNAEKELYKTEEVCYG